MRVVVTGGSGKAGMATVRELLAHDYEVLSVDRIPPAERLCPFRQLELTEMGHVYGALVGADAVVHLAAITSPYGQPNEVVFGNNIMSTFNVVDAAANLDLERVVYASSESGLGFPFPDNRIVPDYMPVDEAHPLKYEDPYALSKIMGEEVCKTATRRTGMPSVALRFSNITLPEDYATRMPPRWANPESGVANLWSYVDVRDVALSCRLALEAQIEDFEAFYIAAADSFMNVPTRELVRTYFPELDESDMAPEWDGYQSCLSTAKAKALLGYEPQYSWRDHLRVEEGEQG